MSFVSPLIEFEMAALMRRAQAGDTAAYERVLLALLPLVQRYVAARVFDRAQADDVVQEILLSLHRARHTYDAAQPLLPWVYAIARYRLIDARRRAGRCREDLQEDDEQIFCGALPMPEGGDVRSALLDEALAHLPPKPRAVVQFLKCDGLSVAEVAQRTGQSPAAVKVMAHRAYQSMRRWFAERGYGST